MADTLTVIDTRPGKKIELPIEHGAIHAAELTRLGIVSYDPALLNTAACKSKISYIDGERGILRYRGYPIEELAEKSSFLETAYLIVKGEMPTTSHFKMWQRNITMHTLVHESVRHFIEGFRYDAHPMGILIATVGALSTFYPEAKHVTDLESRRGVTPRPVRTMAAGASLPFPRHPGLPSGALANRPSAPRARIIKQNAHEFCEVTAKNPLIDIALELERIALEDNSFVSRRLSPNVDFYSGIIYEAMGLPVAMFPVLFAIARTAGWMAQWAEMLLDEEQKITRPKQLYVGYDERRYVPLDQRRDGGAEVNLVTRPMYGVPLRCQ